VFDQTNPLVVLTDRKVFKPRVFWRKGLFLTSQLTLSTTHLFTALMTFYHHEADFNYYPTTTSAAARRLDERPFLNQPRAVNQFSGPAHDILADRWGMATKQGSAFGSQPSLPGGAGFGEHRSKVSSKSCLTRGCLDPVAEATSYNLGFDGYSQPSFTNHCWPAQSQQPYLGQAGSSDWGTFPTRSTMAPGPSRMIPTPSDGKIFFLAASRNPMLTDHEQSRSVNGERTRAVLRQARSTG
jgi:hypothetical protein